MMLVSAWPSVNILRIGESAGLLVVHVKITT